MGEDLVSQEVIEGLAGGYKRPADQLRALHALGFHRARLGKLTRRVILERPHYEAVCAGRELASNDAHQPKVRPLRRVK